MVEVREGGTTQARYERDVIWDTVLSRLQQLDLGDRSLVFGRIDQATGSEGAGGETYYIGRIAVADSDNEPVVVDWRAPVAEPFYRATGRSPMGLVRRRHFATRGRELLGLEDEYFGEAALELGIAPDEAAGELTGRGALVAAIEAPRTGLLADIVGTIQAEQDEIIRSELPGVLVVQGGPGTGKTVVALHRAAYLLYTHRFPLEGQGVLVVGPNRLFLGYIERVLPSLGESGVELALLADLIPDVRVTGRDRGLVARVKGDLRMVDVIRKAVRDRQRPLRRHLVVGMGLTTLKLTVDESAAIIAEARRRFRTHNGARKYVEAEVFAHLAQSGTRVLDAADVRTQLRRTDPVREALEWMWPVLTPAELLHDLFGSRPLLALAAGRKLSAEEHESLFRHRSASAEDVVFTTSDVPLLDEARARLGHRPGHRSDDEIRTYGHIVVDEAQDLSPMELRSLSRRSLNGSMTVVGDIAQSTGAWAHESWDEVQDHLPDRRPARVAALTIGYRIPEPIMRTARGVLEAAAPGLQQPRSVRTRGEPPTVVPVDGADDLLATVAEIAAAEAARPDGGSVGVIVPTSLLDATEKSLTDAGVAHGRATRTGLRQSVTLVGVEVVKGLELDSTIVVEPARIVAEEPQPMRSLYVALTRSTKRLTIVHHQPLPDPLAEGLRG